MPARRRITAAAVLMVVAGCESMPVARPVHLRAGATYASPAGNFTAVVPPLLGPGVTEAEAVSDDGTAAGVRFADDFGTLLDVRSTRIPDEQRPTYAAGSRDATLAGDFDARVLPALRADDPAAAVLTRTAGVDTPAGPALFAAVAMPGGSTRTAPGPDGRPVHPDAVRGVLVFARFQWLYVVQVQLWPRTPDGPELSRPEQDARLLADLRQAAGLMTFN